MEFTSKILQLALHKAMWQLKGSHKNIGLELEHYYLEVISEIKLGAWPCALLIGSETVYLPNELRKQSISNHGMLIQVLISGQYLNS